MTKLPHDSWDVKGVDGPRYKVGPKCSVANCGRWADHAHHIWRRSFLAGDYRWVCLWDEFVVQNLTGLCFDHHQAITENKATIRFAEATAFGTLGQFSYVDDDGEQVLVPQPKLLAEFTAGENVDVDVREPEEPACPTCGHKRKPRDLPAGVKRNRVSWTVSVPKDERENGAAVLDELEYGCAEKLGRADHASHKYYTLTEVMATFLLGNVEVSDFVRGTDEDDGA